MVTFASGECSLDAAAEGEVRVNDVVLSATDGDLDGSRPFLTEKKVDDGLELEGDEPAESAESVSSALMRCAMLDPILFDFLARAPLAAC